MASDGDFLDLLDELREASMAYEDAYADCPPDGRLTCPPLCDAADRLHDVATRYAAARERRSAGTA